MSETRTQDTDEAARQPPQGKLPFLSLSALGIVFGDIGTSPLYTFKTILSADAAPDASVVLGSLSLVLWTLFIITTVKYVSFAMRVDNDGEGGILALMALLGVKKQQRPTIVAVGLLGAALIYGDGAITPAISVLSALEGLNMATPAFQPYVVPAAIAILLALFAIQSQGTATIGRFFGPVMLVWFVAIAVMGVSGIVHHPSVLAALSPTYGLSYLFSHGVTGFLVLGAVFLCVTGAEALYADMGHFGKKPIRLAWFAIVFPSLILNYAGQAALVLEGAPTDGNIFFRYFLFRNVSFNCLGDHPLLLDRGQTIDALVVGKRFIVCRNKAFDLCLAEIAQHFDPQMTIKQRKDLGSRVSWTTTGGSTNPISRMEAAICRYLWLAFAVFSIDLTGRMALMSEKRVRHLPVFEGKRPIGIVSISDLVKSKIGDQKFMIDQLEHYIHG